METSQTLAFFLYVFVLFLCVVVSCQFDKFNKYELPQGAIGPGSVAFCGLFSSEGPFTTVTDGRILKWQGFGFVDFAYTSPARTKQLCDGTTDPDLGPICGRPVALSFNTITKHLYIADLYRGLLVVGPNGGLATQLARGFKFLTGLDVDIFTGHVYMHDASLTFDIGDTTVPGFVPDSTGRLLRYDPRTRQVSVLLSGLYGGGGPAVSSDGTFVLDCELVGMRILKYWLVGPKANTAEVLLNVTGNPFKIKRAETFGEFWVAISIGYVPQAPLGVPEGVRFNSKGVVKQTVSFARQFFNKSISVVQEHDGKLYVGSFESNFIGVYCNK